ncbi:Cro/Cl family transcriptional regulator [Endozoicomonas sp. SM1973]|uniref:Cro/Cl family transcriptional regulator n=1 Tax=Spartinivicinus marinus TaxID=2994442 RepID=A0A853IH48_9GAMM|nr:Cro/Cl family transcriptional regulator [Spartinivicinus marinus]
MTVEQAVSYFGSKTKLANFLGLNKSSITHWGNTVPSSRAYQLQVLTNGELKVVETQPKKLAPKD